MDFLTYPLNILASAGAGIGAWFVTNLIAKPILVVREKRLEALRVAERNAYLGPEASDERARAVRIALMDAASDLRVHARGQPWPVRLYIHLLGYNFEEAALAIRGLAEMAGNNWAEVNRTRNLIHVYECLRAHHPFTPEEMADYREAIKHDRQR